MRTRLLVLVALSGCSNSAVPREPSVGVVTLAPPTRTPAAGRGDFAAQQTALVTLELHPDGSVAVTGVTRKPIPFRGSRLVPFDARGHEAPATSYLLIVHPPEPGALPRAVPLDLGARGEGGGDVVDRWNGSSVLVRAPSWGEGTRFTVLREGPSGPTQLAERAEVE